MSKGSNKQRERQREYNAKLLREGQQRAAKDKQAKMRANRAAIRAKKAIAA